MAASNTVDSEVESSDRVPQPDTVAIPLTRAYLSVGMDLVWTALLGKAIGMIRTFLVRRREYCLLPLTLSIRSLVS